MKRHPLLKNPVKWLQGAAKGHSAGLYDSSAYNLHDLTNNPFAQALADHRADHMVKRFPTGNMIQLVMKKIDGQYNIVPVLEKPKAGNNPANYVLNRASYIAHVQQTRFLPVPQKIRQRDKKLMGSIRVVEDFEGVHRKKLEEAIRSLLEQKQAGDGPGLRVLPGQRKIPGNGPVEWEGKVPRIYSTLVDEELFLPFDKNLELCQLLLKHAQFCDIQAPEGSESVSTKNAS